MDHDNYKTDVMRRKYGFCIPMCTLFALFAFLTTIDCNMTVSLTERCSMMCISVYQRCQEDAQDMEDYFNCLQEEKTCRSIFCRKV